ncbi:MAG TPA: glycosyl hydrolase family 79 C-terminal domain-containing protein [Solirubrobacteraceae bacterium]|nr:glycosyl hydrolase family 79 C-terminal domain-containing protein [Solirubrobacteraceae bacterium]
MSGRVSGILAILAVGLATVTGTLFASYRSSAHEHHSVARLTLIVGKPTGRTIPPGFLGLSFEYSAVRAYAGDEPDAINPVLLQLIRNLAPGQAPSLRIGGDSTDWTWWPVAGLAKPHGVRYTLTPTWMEVTAALAHDLSAKLTVGINLEVDSGKVAGAEARALISAIGLGSIRALELGNEPELYGSLAWYIARNGRHVTGRRKSYDFPAYQRDFARISRSLPRVTLAGPTVGGPMWIPKLGRFLPAHPRVKLATLHRYPLQLCHLPAASTKYPTVPHLLAPDASEGLADSVARSVGVAHARHVALRIDEMNSVSCGGAPGISDGFVASLWALDAVFQMARVGVDGVNIHTYPGAPYEPFRFTHRDGQWQAFVAPEYYGLEMFAQAAPPGARLLGISGSLGNVRAWATRAPNGTVHVVLINDYTARSRTVAVRIPGVRGAATLERLIGRGITARTGVTLGGQTYGRATTTGLLAGDSTLASVTKRGGGYVVRLPRASAAMLTIAPGSPA